MISDKWTATYPIVTNPRYGNTYNRISAVTGRICLSTYKISLTLSSAFFRSLAGSNNRFRSCNSNTLHAYSNRNGIPVFRTLKRQSYPCDRPCRTIWLSDVKAPTFSRQSAHRWPWGWQALRAGRLYHHEDSWYSFLFDVESSPGS
jgi:hypothetical protein